MREKYRYSIERKREGQIHYRWTTVRVQQIHEKREIEREGINKF